MQRNHYSMWAQSNDTPTLSDRLKSELYEKAKMEIAILIDHYCARITNSNVEDNRFIPTSWIDKLSKIATKDSQVIEPDRFLYDLDVLNRLFTAKHYEELIAKSRSILS